MSKTGFNSSQMLDKSYFLPANATYNIESDIGYPKDQHKKRFSPPHIRWINWIYTIEDHYHTISPGKPDVVSTVSLKNRNKLKVQSDSNYSATVCIQTPEGRAE